MKSTYRQDFRSKFHHSILTSTPAVAIDRKISKMSIIFERNCMGPNPLRLFLNMMTPTQIKEYRTVPGRNTPEVIRTWKQYSGRKISGAFGSLSCAFPPGFDRKSPEIFLEEYWFHVPMTSSVFLQDLASSGSGHWNLRPGYI